ncbi:hypothetical protein KUCAC02_024917 [Chaenocephalus aceratus]|nr:hypothetical protein KUCAC02_024917 [Chaenocephalus aceratus]
MLAERKVELERRLHAMLEENELLQSSVDELRERTMLLERHSHHKDLQLRQSQAELQEAQLSRRRLSLRLQLWEAYSEVRSLCSHCGEGTTSPTRRSPPTPPWTSPRRRSSAKDVPTGSLHTGLLELRDSPRTCWTETSPRWRCSP